MQVTVCDKLAEKVSELSFNVNSGSRAAPGCLTRYGLPIAFEGMLPNVYSTAIVQISLHFSR